MLLMPSEDLVQSSWKTQSSNRSFRLDTSRKTWKLTWPKNRKGKRNVSPLHIQDWNPSAETEKQSLVMFCFVFLECSHSDFTAQQLDVWGSRSVSSVLQRVGTSVTLHADVNNCPHLSPLPHFPHPDMMLQMTQTTEMVLIKNSSPTVRSSWFLSPKARSLYKQPLW